MKLEYMCGCICDSLTVDGIEEIDLTDEQRILIIEKIGSFISKASPDKLNYILQFLIPEFGKFEDLGHCECCGDIIEKYTLNICVEK